MRRRTLVAIAWAVVLLDILAVSLLGVGVLPTPASSPVGSALIIWLLTVIYGIVGTRVITRDPRNRVGWVLWVQPTLTALWGAGGAYAQLSLDQYEGSLPGTAFLAWAGGFTLVLFILLTDLVVPLLFPTGYLLSKRWRPVAVLVTAAVGLTMFGMMFDPAPVLPGLANPVGIPGASQALELVRQIGVGCVLVALPLVVASVVSRFRGGRAVERQQIKWFAVGILVPAVLLVAALAGGDAEWLWVSAVCALALTPISIGIAILRYRLYEIDRLISRTIGWAVVSGVLVVVFAGLVIVLQTVLAPFTKENTLAVAGSTLVAFALFQPLRRRVQRAVDRRFDRARYDGQRTVDAFAERVRNEVDLGTLRASLSATATDAVRPTNAGVWLSSKAGRG